MTDVAQGFKARFPLDAPLRLTFDAQGLIPVIAQDALTSQILLLAYMNAEALDVTLASGKLTLWSRSRGALWRKGETSGQSLRIRELRVNCEANSLLAMVEQEGVAACHEGYRACFYRMLRGESSQAFSARVVETRSIDPAILYSKKDEDGATLEQDARALYAAYERLRDAPLLPDSHTSTLLHVANTAEASRQALARAAEELEELRGVVSGTHHHFGGERDVVLEASQVGYWTLVAAVARGLPYDAWKPHRAWLAGWDGVRLVAAEGMDEAHDLLAAPLWEAGAYCRVAGTHPALAVAADLKAMLAKHGTPE